LRDEQGQVVKWYGVSTDIEDLKRAEERIKATSEQLRALSVKLQSAKEEEEIRIARRPGPLRRAPRIDNTRRVVN